MKFPTPIIVATLGLLIGAPLSHSATITVPNSLQTTEGNSNNDFPFSDVTRYQQVFSSAEFSSITGPVYITAISVRPDGAGAAFTKTIGNIKLSLSTSSRAPDNLSSTFATNIGLDEAVVFNGALLLSTAFTGPAGGPKDFDINIPITPFLYNPAAGNLLLDVVTPTATARNQLDGVNVLGDGTSRIATQGLAVTSPTANLVDTNGLVVRFTVVPEPGTALFGIALAAVAITRRARRPITH